MDMMEGWHDFFVATVGAAAALAGLIIVAISVNIRDIITIPSMSSRAAATVASLVLSLVSTSLMLVPGQPVALLGLEVLLVAAITTVIVVHSAVQMLRAGGFSPAANATRVSLMVLLVVPFLIGAVSLIAGLDQGVSWVAAGVLLVFVGSVTNAWVLLVEILR
jgi:hypothetical protein